MDIFFWTTRCLLLGSWPLAQRSLCLGFRSGSRTRDGFPQASAVAIVRLEHGHVFGAVRPCHGFVQGGLRWESLEVEADAVEAQVASVREDGHTHFICLTFDIIVWMFSCTRQFFMCQTWSGTHNIKRVLSSAARAPPCPQMAGCGFSSVRTRIRWCFTCLACSVNHRDTPVPTDNTTSLQPSSSRLQIFAKTDGLTLFICSY